MELPIPIVNLLTVLLTGGTTWLVVSGIKGIGNAFGKDFSSAAKNVAAIISASVITAVFGVIDLGIASVPEAYIPVLSAVLTVVANWLTAAGIQYKTKQVLVG